MALLLQHSNIPLDRYGDIPFFALIGIVNNKRKQTWKYPHIYAHSNNLIGFSRADEITIIVTFSFSDSCLLPLFRHIAFDSNVFQDNRRKPLYFKYMLILFNTAAYTYISMQRDFSQKRTQLATKKTTELFGWMHALLTILKLLRISWIGSSEFAVISNKKPATRNDKIIVNTITSASFLPSFSVARRPPLISHRFYTFHWLMF